MEKKMKYCFRRLISFICAVSMIVGSMVTDFSAFTVYAEEVSESLVVKKVWNFRKDSTTQSMTNELFREKDIQGGLEEIDGLIIDATASGAKFYTKGRNDWVQINKDTIVKIPTEGPCKVTAEVYSDGQFSLDEKVSESTTMTVESDGSSGYVTFKALNNTYLGKITLDTYNKGYIEGGTHSFKSKKPLSISGLSLDNVTIDGNSHGFITKTNAKLVLNLSKKANVTITTCGFTAGSSAELKINDVMINHTALPKEGSEDTQYGYTWSIEDAKAGFLTIDVNNNVYIHDLTVEYLEEEPETFAVNVTTSGHGTVSANCTVAKAGDNITLYATPDENYEFDKWVTGDVTITDNKFTMPSNIVSINGIFKEKATEGGEEGGEAGGGEEGGETGGGEVGSGEVVLYNFSNMTPSEAATKVGINTADFSDAKNKHGIVTKNDNTKLTLSLKEEATVRVRTCGFLAGLNATVTPEDGTYETLKKAEKMFSSDNSNGYEFTIRGAKAGEFALNINKNVYIHEIEVTYEKYVPVPEYAITVSNDGNGTATANCETASEGDVVSLDYVPNAGYKLKEWQVVSGGVTVENDKFTMGTAPVEVKAIFEAKSYHGITLTTDGNGTVSANTLEAAKDDKVTLSYKANEGYKFKEWQTTPAGIEIKAGSNEFIMPDEEVTVKAIFEKVDDTVVYDGQPITLPNKLPSQINIPGIVIDDTFMGDNADPAKTNSHGIYTGAVAGSKITVNLKQKANIQVITCGFCAGTTATLDVTAGDKAYTVERKELDVGDKGPGVQFDANGLAAGKTVLTFGANIFIHSISIEYVKEIDENTKRKIDVWDIGGVKLGEDATHINYITKDTLSAQKVFKTTKGEFNGTALVFDDLTIAAYAGDRYYNSAEDFSAYSNGTYGFSDFEYEDGYKSTGAWYANGTGGAGRRYMTVQNVQAGDKLIVYGGISQSGPSQIIIEGQGTAAPQKAVFAVKAGEFQKMEVVAEKTGTFKIYESEAGKPFFHRVVRVPGVKVEGTINYGDYTGTEHTVKFTNKTTRQVSFAKLNGNKFSVRLAPGYEYTASLSGAKGFGFSNECKKITVNESEVFGGKTVELAVVPKEMITYSGKITGFADGYNISKLAVRLVADAEYDADEADVTIGEDLSFSAIIEPEVPYSIVLSGVNDYEVKSDAVVKSEEDFTADITVGLKKLNEVTGSFIDVEGNKIAAEVTALTFENVDDKYVYTATVANGGYTVALRSGSYLAKATVEGYSTKTHVVVEDAAVTRDLLFVATATKPAIDKVSDIYVGYKDKANNYETVNKAMEACALMNPTSEEERITVHIAPGVYREQIMVTAPYVSFVNDTGKDVVLTWYYGIGYKYYSADKDGYYNPENAYDKFERRAAAKWGTAVYVKKTATAFRAEGITFENSFNRYITDEELEDGVQCDTLKVERNYGTDVLSKAATERAAALCVESQNTEYKNCKFYSSQDTLYTAGNAYFKNCFIEGQTDYIFGSGNVVFDTCELSFKGYSSNSLGGYITANRPEASSEVGYLFRNCAVTGNNNVKVTVTPGYFGRPWGADAKVTFLNTKLQSKDIIVPDGWYDMTGAPEDANYYEYNTKDFEGNEISTKSRRGHVMDKAAADAVKVENYFGSWQPAFYQTEDADLKFEVKPFITDNGDLNTPYPGHTLSVGYSLGANNDSNDISSIKWYRVTADGDELVKTATAVNDKKYKISREDIGSKIKVTVTPETVSGRTAAAESCVTEFAVLDGYENPDAEGPEGELGDGVNIFLAGDSTVKDYRASGINSGGSARNEGSWGEYFETFFNSDKVTVLDYANGGRSSRSFINDGSIKKIEDKIGEGDYLFIQFGHNDCADGAEYLDERYAPLGKPDANGIYPTTEGKKVATPAQLSTKGYGSECYTYDCGGSYKWYLKQYIEVAKKKGATPVLVTPVARLYYNADGTIRPHHDDSTSSNNAYVTAVKQLGEEENVLVIDGFGLTKSIMEDAFKAGGEDYGKQIMNTGDKTHNNKIGGMIEAEAIINALLDVRVNGKPLSIVYAMKAPTKVIGVTTENKTVFSIDANGKLVAYDVLKEYAEEAPYWMKVGQEMLSVIAKKAAEFEGKEPENPDKPDKPGEEPTGKGWEITLPGGDSYEYTGAAITPEVIVTFDGKELEENVDYAVKYANNVNANAKTTKKATITVTGKGNLAGKKITEFTITQKNISDSDVTVGKIITDNAAKAVPVVVYNGIVLKNKADYTATYDAKASVMNIVATDKNFTGKATAEVKVVAKADLKKFAVTLGKEKLSYNGSEQMITVTVNDAKDKTKKLVENTDYVLAYSEDIVSAGNKNVTVIGMGEYSGAITKKYAIKPAVVTGDVSAKLSKSEYVFNVNGVAVTDDLTVTLKSTTVSANELTYGKDYTVKCANNKKVGTAKYTVSFIGNFKGTKALNGTFDIKPAVLSDKTVGVVSSNMIYKGKADIYKAPVYVCADGVALKSGKDYTVEYFSDADMKKAIDKNNKITVADNSSATVYVKVTGKGNFAGDTKAYATTSYEVINKSNAIDLSKAKLTVVDEKGAKVTKIAYTGSEITPNVRIEVNGKELTEEQYATVSLSYVNNVNKGSAIIVVNGGAYGDLTAGNKTAKFSIVATNIDSIAKVIK